MTDKISPDPDTDDPSRQQEEPDGSPASAGRRDAVTKLAYASPVLAGLLFSKRSAAESFTPPSPPGG